VRVQLARARQDARRACDVDLAKARALKDDVKRSRAELAAEAHYQSELRRIERDNRRKAVASTARRSSARERLFFTTPRSTPTNNGQRSRTGPTR